MTSFSRTICFREEAFLVSQKSTKFEDPFSKKEKHSSDWILFLRSIFTLSLCKKNDSIGYIYCIKKNTR